MTRYDLVIQTWTDPEQSYLDCLRIDTINPDKAAQKRPLIERLMLRLLLALTLSFMMVLPVQAGDEEFNPSAYQIFDPTTGYFIDVEPPTEEQPAAGTQNHTATVTDQTGSQAVGSEPVAATAETGTTAPPAASTSQTPLIAGVVLLILIAVFAFRKRKGEHS